MTEIVFASQVISAGLSPHKMLLDTAVPGKGFEQAIAPPGLEAMLLLNVQLVIIGAEFVNEIAPPLTAALLLLKMELTSDRFGGIKCQPAAVPIGCVVLNNAVGNGRRRGW